MNMEQKLTYQVREALPQEYTPLGKLMADVYSNLPGFPGRDEMPEYYEMLEDIGSLTVRPGIKIVVAVSAGEKLLGGVVYIDDMQYYGSGGTATAVKHAAGFRLLVVDPGTRGMGIGKVLSEECIRLASDAGKNEVVIHTTKSMQLAWKIYEKLGFRRSPDLDFLQHNLEVFGFRLKLK
jgi:GNAT superfamily N-acetyltransferase